MEHRIILTSIAKPLPAAINIAAAALALIAPAAQALQVGVVALLAALLLGACAGPQPQLVLVGQSESQVLSAMGPATGRYPLAGGAQRLEFARGPAGRLTWMVDLDAGGQVLQVEQVLDNPHFEQVLDGMPRDALLRLLGRPAARQREYQDRETWSWRYETHDCLWFRVTLSAEGRVLGGGAQMIDPACDASRSAERR